MSFVAKKIFLTKGVGKHRERLSSFELALRNAGIAACNIVRVSSIFPPNCKLISRSEGLKHIKPGQVAFTVISENSTKEAHRLIAASIGLALPSDKSMYGYLSEHHSFGETEEVAGEYAEELAAEMLATTLNVEFDPALLQLTQLRFSATMDSRTLFEPAVRPDPESAGWLPSSQTFRILLPDSMATSSPGGISPGRTIQAMV